MGLFKNPAADKKEVSFLLVLIEKFFLELDLMTLEFIFCRFLESSSTPSLASSGSTSDGEYWPLLFLLDWAPALKVKKLELCLCWHDCGWLRILTSVSKITLWLTQSFYRPSNLLLGLAERVVLGHQRHILAPKVGSVYACEAFFWG